MTNTDFRFEITDDTQLRTAIAVDFFLHNCMAFVEQAIEEKKDNIQLAKTVDNVAKLSFTIADMFLANKNAVVGTTEETEFNYV